MTPDREQPDRADLPGRARARTDPARAAFLAEACAGDAALQRDVESLLAQESAAAGFMSTPAAALASGTMRRRRVLHRPAPGAVRHSVATWRRRHGRGVPRARHEARPRRRHQDPAARSSRAIPSAAARFEREARLLASLNHPNIGAIYGLEDVGRRAARWSSSSSRARRFADRLGPKLEPRAQPLPDPLDEALDDRAADRRGARAAHETRHRPPRSEAGQHQDHAGRRREGARLRPGQSRWPAMRPAPTCRSRRRHVRRDARRGRSSAPPPT